MGTHDTPPAGGRRVDRVLAVDFLAGLHDAPLAEVRRRRGEAEQEEVDLSYLRRLVQGRLDAVRAELNRRAGQGAADAVSLVQGLPTILADEPRAPARGLGRHTTVEPSRAGSHRRYVEALIADVRLSDVTHRTTAELADALGTLSEEERRLSATRRAVQAVMDECGAEITRRYRDGEADVASLLAGPSPS